MEAGSTTAGPPNNFRTTFVLSPTFRLQNGCDLLHPTHCQPETDTMRCHDAVQYQACFASSLKRGSIAWWDWAQYQACVSTSSSSGMHLITCHPKHRRGALPWGGPRRPTLQKQSPDGQRHLAKPRRTETPALPHVAGFVPHTQHVHLDAASQRQRTSQPRTQHFIPPNAAAMYAPPPKQCLSRGAERGHVHSTRC